MQDIKMRGMYAMEGHVPQPGSSSSPAVEVKRRSERVKREKPNFYDALEYDNQMRKARKERQKEEQSQQASGRIKRERKIKHSSEPEDDEDEEPVKEKRKRKKKKSSNGDKKEEEIDEDIMAGISPEKEWQFSMVLSDINMKLGLNNPKFNIF
ncbi:UNVERIFIED_CONTAM: hypothetical protein GTU68_014815 [Idotea baltica]|nr:hypothetical protein [Idotea baltica]